MQIIRSDNGDEGTGAITKRLNGELAKGKAVLWLVSGGSQIEANVKIMSGINESLSQNLTVMPVDERYGPPGHPDSNWDKMLAAGFKPKHATALSALKEGLSFQQNIKYFEQLIDDAFVHNTCLIGQLGIGPDGHTSGILPHSPACEETSRYVSGYEAPPFKRLTTTFAALRQLDAAYVLAFGESKRETLENLSHDLPLEEQPAQILKQLPEAYIYTDQIKENDV
jgi:6-phosphogluconolactonase/glucosamine-6-phosphate isomerase/deaminase